MRSPSASRRPKAGVPVLALAAILCAVVPGFAANEAQDASASVPPAYHGMKVTDGGAVRGVVKAPPLDKKLKPLVVTKDVKVCGRRIPNESFIRSAEGFIKNAVVSIEGITRGKRVNVTTRYKLENTHCQFEPHVLAVTVGQKVEIVNRDPILHGTHALLDDKLTLFNVALPVQNQMVPKTITKPGVLYLRCDAGHTWMSGYIVAFEHPYFAVTGEDGSFLIDGIPPGTYKLRAWHERLGKQVQEVKVRPGVTTDVVFDHLAS